MDIESLLTEASDQRKTLGKRLMTQHTPGPWTLDVWPAGDVIGIDGGKTRVAIIKRLGKMSTTDHANAKLIAAAPALLEALKAFVTDVEDFIDPDGEFDFSPEAGRKMVRQARQAIEDASGKEN